MIEVIRDGEITFVSTLADAIKIAHQPGDIVYCPPGAYRYPGTLYLPPGVSLLGAGGDKTIIYISQPYKYLMRLQNIFDSVIQAVCDLTLSGESA